MQCAGVHVWRQEVIEVQVDRRKVVNIHVYSHDRRHTSCHRVPCTKCAETERGEGTTTGQGGSYSTHSGLARGLTSLLLVKRNPPRLHHGRFDLGAAPTS